MSDSAIEETNLIRVMVPLFDIIEIPTLISIFQNFRPRIWQLINNKFGIYLIQKVIERGIDASISPESSKFLNERNEKELMLSARQWIENICLQQHLEMLGKRYSKYVLFRVIVGAIYSNKFPENLQDDENSSKKKQAQILVRN